MTEGNGKSNCGMASSLLLGMLIGAVGGIAIGLLYAPKSGRDTRDLIREKAMRAKDKASDLVSEVKTAATRARGAGSETDEDVSGTD